jgi:hypothetical protein
MIRPKDIYVKLGLNRRSAAFIIKNEALCVRIMNEDPIRLREAARKYNVAIPRLNKLVRNNILSSFSNIKQQGSPIFIFENELIDVVGNGNYNRNSVSVAALIKSTFELYLGIMENIISERELSFLIDYLIHKKTLVEICKERELTATRVSSILIKGFSKGKRHLMAIPDYYKLTDEVFALELKKNQLNKMLKEFSSKNKDVVDAYNLHSYANTLILSKLNFSVRAIHCMNANDVITMGDLLSHTREEVLKFRNLGRLTIMEIDEELRKYNFNFKFKKNEMD